MKPKKQQTPSPSPRKKPVNLLDAMTPEERAKVDAARERREEIRASFITKEWFELAELGFYFGWAAIEAVLNDVITLDQARKLVEGADKIHSGHVYDSAIAIAAGTSHNTTDFHNLMKNHINNKDAIN